MKIGRKLSLCSTSERGGAVNIAAAPRSKKGTSARHSNAAMSWTMLLSASLALHLVIMCHAQNLLGEYPPISSVATFRPATASSTCGIDGAETYCRFTTDSTASLAPNCISDVCNSTCPYSSSSPSPIPIATLGSLGSGVMATQGRPGSSTAALEFANSSISVLAARVPLVGDRGMSFAAWINQDQGNTGYVKRHVPDWGK